MELTADALARFKDLVYRQSHLTFPPSREAQFLRSLVRRATEGKYQSIDEYCRALSSDQREFARLLSLITTGETYFFRIPGHFQALSDVVLPEIIDREGKAAMEALARGERYRMKLRAWSAGCSTGQEAYSLAMQILGTVRYPKAWDLRVLGTDISADALETARLGRYDRARLQNAPSHFVERCFKPRQPGEVVVSDEVKEITAFQVKNLKSLPGDQSFREAFDIIFCRNVLIYFDLAAQQRLITDLSACLKPGGYLFTGEGEVLHIYRHVLDAKEHGGCIFYKNPEGR
jgi:chemotaxis protein methyltransferase CheR